MELQVLEPYHVSHLLCTVLSMLNPHSNYVVLLRGVLGSPVCASGWGEMSLLHTTMAAGVGCWEHFKVAVVCIFLLPSPNMYLKKIPHESPPLGSSKVLTFWDTLENKIDKVPALTELHSCGKHGRVSINQSTKTMLW